MTVTDVTRILVCEDSRTYAAGLRRFLEHDRDLQVIGSCDTVAEAVALCARLKPDLLILDLELADGNGVRAIDRILARGPVPIVVLSEHVARGSAAAAAALGAGALDAQPKRALPIRDPGSARGVMFRRHLKRLSRAHVTKPSRTSRGGRRAAGVRRDAAAIGICASTGGPPALRTVLTALPADFPIPVLIVQHMTKGFLPGFVEWLRESVKLPVGIAGAGVPLRRGIWFAGDGAHLALDQQRRMRLDRSTNGGFHCPAGDVLLASMASVLGPGAASVVLTGMGSDGAEGTAAVGAAGGLTIAQDASSSAVYGMPRAARERGAELVLPLGEIGPMLGRLHLTKAAP
jgi:two-component system chemotaxis response regulator CheB